jgi:Holliday junction resolvase
MSREKDRGTAWETAVVAYLNSHGVQAYRVAQHGARDVGDIHVAGRDVVLEAKDWKSPGEALPVAADQAAREAVHAGAALGVSIIKRPRRPVGEAYAVIRLSDLAKLLEDGKL